MTKRYRHALVVGKFAPLHAGHQLLIDRANELADELTLVIWANPDFPDMPNEVRAGWLRTLYPHACVLVGVDGPNDRQTEHEHRLFTQALLRRNGRSPDVVLTSEAYGEPFAAVLGIDHVLVDVDRVSVPASGSLVRGDVHGHRHLLDPRVYRHFVQLVVIMGAESTGKTTLAELLAEEFQTTWVPEYGRTHYEERGGRLDLADYVTIAEVHRQHEELAALSANRYVFCDTNAITTMFFSHYYNRDSLPALHDYANECRQRYAHVFVCDDDIPFEQDGWRDTLEWRTRMQGMVLHDLRVRSVPFTIVSGSLEQRVAAVRHTLQTARTR
jgi:HTH-type transcriptional regulator, transcriptional repressor of NAD biosynthesis genes